MQDTPAATIATVNAIRHNQSAAPTADTHAATETTAATTVATTVATTETDPYPFMATVVVYGAGPKADELSAAFRNRGLMCNQTTEEPLLAGQLLETAERASPLRDALLGDAERICGPSNWKLVVTVSQFDTNDSYLSSHQSCHEGLNQGR